MYPTTALITTIAAERRREAQREMRARAASRPPGTVVARIAPVRAALIALWASR